MPQVRYQCLDKRNFRWFLCHFFYGGGSSAKLAKTAINKLDLKLENIIVECFDGAANMSGIRKGLAMRMKECSPLGIYVHCYGHLLNLALQDTMTENETLRNALGTI